MSNPKRHVAVAEPDVYICSELTLLASRKNIQLLQCLNQSGDIIIAHSKTQH